MAAQPFPGYTSYKYFLVTTPSPLVAHVEINRPEKLNAFHEAMWLELGAIFRRLSTDPDVRAVVLSGAGERAFTAGLDVTAAASNEGILGGENVDPARKAAKLRRHIEEFQGSISEVERCEKPVICVLHGVSMGLAIDISCCADIRVCARDTRFAVKEVDIGLAADIGTLARLPKAVGSLSWVKDICLTARDFSAAEALAVGFVSQVHDSKAAALAAAFKTAAFLATKSPVAVQGTKELLNHSRDHPVDDNLRYTKVWNAAAVQTTDVTAALTSGLQKRKPTFEKL
ncbi:ClpP/crotonase-like domain-containing protein [Staphylotrichum tortipilum]|uniref:ClpP/crotonase-like domain-containing protein n=1 Tax=Staphylotrichum tortipilum TaxID=2831512 RepID=A0AAN6MF31_9PEZI|nr:ClpP/crotonase-like domain-containing protein [Staphylotrichum longicolle]